MITDVEYGLGMGYKKNLAAVHAHAQSAIDSVERDLVGARAEIRRLQGELQRERGLRLRAEAIAAMLRKRA